MIGNISDGYGGQGGEIQGQLDRPVSSGDLPLTGFDLLVPLLFGVILVIAGILLRRRGGKTQ